ncbi:MAG: diaminopimelate epimerase [Desulfovibrionaceae bacterium]|nr:diaminopimelate epimerase [Desulfovibrionaceae bacterium]
MAKVLHFTKMQGIGNDYVYVNCFKETVGDPHALARFVSDRHFGIGGDGLVLIMPSTTGDIRMRMFNADGTEAEMCGNASRCVAKFAADHNLVTKDSFALETAAGIKHIQLVREGSEVVGACVDMGEPILEPKLIPLAPSFCDKPKALDVALKVAAKEYRVTCVSMGNPHAVIFVDDIKNLDLPVLGPQFENNPAFPKRINTEFVHVLSADHLEMRVWERGAGETLACGTGACAATVAAALTNRSLRSVTMTLTGGDLQINWDAKTNHVFMTGPAVTVFDGSLFLENIPNA